METIDNVENFRELMKKYEGKTDKQKRAIKREVHANGYGGGLGKLVAYGKLWEQNKPEGSKAPEYRGNVTDAGSGKVFTISMWWNNGTPRFEIVQPYTADEPIII